MKFFVAGSFVFLSVLAAAVNSTVYDLTFPSDFRNGAYGILLDAEKALTDKDTAEALELFKIGMMRAGRCGRNGIVTRIKTRLATAGYRIADEDPVSASRLLCAYALVSRDFESTSEKVENVLLTKSRGRLTRFEYPLVIKGGKQTFWLDQPRTAPVYLYSLLDPGYELYKLPGHLLHMKAGDLPRGYKYSSTYSLSVIGSRGFRGAELEFDSDDDDPIGVVVGTNDSCRKFYSLNDILKIRSETKEFKLDYQEYFFMINSLVVFSNSHGSRNVEVKLVRNFRPL